MTTTDSVTTTDTTEPRIGLRSRILGRYIVTHHPENPRHRRSVSCDTLAEARRELRIMVGDGVSTIERDGAQIAWRRWRQAGA